MRKIIICVLACYLPLVVAATEIIAPDMELGHWVTKADTSAILEKALASVPEASRAMVRKVMEDKMQDSSTSEQCITKETLSNFDQQIKGAFGGRNDCEFDVTESSREKFAATMNCLGSVTHITTKMVSSKRHESTVVSSVEGMEETKITSVSEWKSSLCPEGL